MQRAVYVWEKGEIRPPRPIWEGGQARRDRGFLLSVSVNKRCCSTSLTTKMYTDRCKKGKGKLQFVDFNWLKNCNLNVVMIINNI